MPCITGPGAERPDRHSLQPSEGLDRKKVLGAVNISPRHYGNSYSIDTLGSTFKCTLDLLGI